MERLNQKWSNGTTARSVKHSRRNKIRTSSHKVTGVTITLLLFEKRIVFQIITIFSRTAANPAFPSVSPGASQN
jgi:hypothetical protein